MRRYDDIAILTGAGISAESGLPTFRDSGGLWADADPVRVGSAAALARDRAGVIDFFNARRRLMGSAQPNAAHRALAALARGGRRRVRIVTQNIDTLHEQAGSRDVHHLHGEADKARCEACGIVAPLRSDLHPAAPCDACGERDALRPHIVLFGEQPLGLAHARQIAETCDLFIAIGTSGAVQPAASLTESARRGGAELVSINLYPQGSDRLFDGVLHGAATNMVSDFVDCLLENRDWRPLATAPAF